MRKKLHKHGDERVVTKFLWLPKTINREMRWLEVATWRERYAYSPPDIFWYSMEWLPVDWVERGCGNE